MDMRTSLQNVIDEFQFRFDLLPSGDYQPLPWIGVSKAKRGEGTRARWEAITETLGQHSIASGMDIGCNMGYFCFALAAKGIPMLGIDMDPRYIRIAEYTSRRAQIPQVGFSQMAVNLQTVRLLPKTDLVLLLSVWHHWVKGFGFETATQLLTALWERCDQVLYFETGEAEMTADFGLPEMNGSPESWLQNYLSQTCPGAQVENLGHFKAFAPQGNEERNVAYRNMFKLTRTRPVTELSRG